MKQTVKPIFFLILLITPFLLPALTIAEKKASLTHGRSDLSAETEQQLIEVNKNTHELHTILRALYAQAQQLYQNQAQECEYIALIDQIQKTQQRLQQIQETWRQKAIEEGKNGYGLWHQPETTLEQLIMDYGSTDCVYLIPLEVGAIKVSIDSQIPVPKNSWNEMLEIILNQNGVGIRQHNPYLKEVYLLQENPGGIRYITSDKKELTSFPPEARVAFLLSPPTTDYRHAHDFLKKFINKKTMALFSLGREVLLIGTTSDILDLLQLYAFVESHKGEREYKVVLLRRVPAEEMIKILQATFGQGNEYALSNNQDLLDRDYPPDNERMSSSIESQTLQVIQIDHLHQALFLSGSTDEVKQAEEMIRNVEKNLSGGREKTLYRYQVRHSDPEMLADVLGKVYCLMKTSGFPNVEGIEPESMINQTNLNIPPPDPRELLPQQLYAESFYQSGSDIVNPAPIEPGKPQKLEDPNKDRNNFIIDLKTSSIIMVVEADLLPQLKELIAKLDVPKKMVQIETLLFEKKIRNRNDFGMNLLRIGDAASNDHRQGARWNDTKKDFLNKGVFQYFISRMKDACGIPAFDLSYKFLLAQDDISINAAPSVVAINNTPATIAIEDEISINTGIFEVETARGVTLKDAFTRAQYGITIVITPTIHLAEDNDDKESYVTLETDITFDTIQRGSNPERPDVTRRHVTNYVSIPDGQTVIIGGLRRKKSDDNKEMIPFLGELPGIGKLFGISSNEDESTEMFLFITPKIINDPTDDFRRLRTEQLCRRPGDIPSFLATLNEARKAEKEQLFEHTLTALFGRGCDLYYVPEGEYDGR